ncbi:MAG: type III pantothenate kinase [Leptospirales bacterium]
MIITVDVGNSETVFGLWNGRSLLKTTRTPTLSDNSRDGWAVFIRNWADEVDEKFRVVMCSVAPSINTPLCEAFHFLGTQDILLVDGGLQFPFEFNPEKFPTIGADRLANLTAAAGFGPHVVVVDFGTAITFCLISDNIYQGGVIVPGIHTTLSALSQKAAKLPQVEYRNKDKILGESSQESIECGVYFSTKGMVREILRELGREIAAVDASNLVVIATGGIITELGFTHEFFDVVDPALTLKGLHRLYELNNRDLEVA